MSVIGQKGLRVQWSVEMCTEEEKGEEEATQTVLRQCRQHKEDRWYESQFSEDLQTLLFCQLCLAALLESKIKIRVPKMSKICSLSIIRILLINKKACLCGNLFSYVVRQCQPVRATNK